MLDDDRVVTLKDLLEECLFYLNVLRTETDWNAEGAITSLMAEIKNEIEKDDDEDDS